MSNLGKSNYYCIITNTIEDNSDGGTKTASTISETAYLEAITLSDILESPVFIEQPASTYLYIQDISCSAEVQNYNAVYRWYETDVTGEAKTPVTDGWSSSSKLNLTDTFTEKGIKHFICAASPYIPNNNDIPEKAVFSQITTVGNTGLPIVFINTPNSTEIISKENWIKNADFSIKNASNDSWNINESTISIKGRGNSSWVYPKKGYNIKFDDKTALFDMPASKKWCLISNYADRSLLHNKFISEISNTIFSDNITWNPNGQFIEIVLNGNYIGNYLLSEKITLEENRINIQDISKVEKKLNDNEESEIIDSNIDGLLDLFDGGFILEIDSYLDGDFSFTTTQGVPIVLKDPDEISEEIKTHIINLVQKAENTLYTTDENNLEWIDYIDIDSVIDWYITNEFSKCLDSYFKTSVYITYNPNTKKLHMGPNWDYDKAFGNCIRDYCNCTKNYDDWYTRTIRGTTSANWITQMFEYDFFISSLKKRWNDINPTLQSSININIDSLAKQISTSAELNLICWPNSGDSIDRNSIWQNSIDYMKEWSLNRITWLNSAINEL